MKRVMSAMACALLLAAAACGPDGEVGPGQLTYYRDIKPIVDAKCVGCHFEGGVAPMSLGAVRALDDAHRAAIAAWVDAGVPAGDPANEGPPLEIEGTTLSRVDLTLTMPEAYLPATAPGQFDDYRCFIVPWPEATTKYVTGFRARPGNAAVAHHAIAFLAPPSQAVGLRVDKPSAEPGLKLADPALQRAAREAEGTRGRVTGTGRGDRDQRA